MEFHQMRVGQGFDLHPLVTGRPFKLGGVLLESSVGPQGHSDGDVLFHALTDALLGASGLGDIGEWFPPSDSKFKDIDSAVLLTEILEAIKQRGWLIGNIDATVLLEAPKLSPYKKQIRQNVAALTGIATDQISVKAKTMEGLGPIGQGQAVAAMVSVLIHSN